MLLPFTYPQHFISFSFVVSHLSFSTVHYSLFTVHCKYQLTRLTRLSLFDETFLIDEIDAIDEEQYETTVKY